MNERGLGARRDQGPGTGGRGEGGRGTGTGAYFGECVTRPGNERGMRDMHRLQKARVRDRAIRSRAASSGTRASRA